MTLRLPRLPGNQPIVDANGIPTILFSTDWQQAMTQIESAINGILAIPEIQEALALVDAAAANANAAAASAQASADSTTAATSLANSYVTNAVLTATDAGSSVTVSISAHQRHYGDGTVVNVNAGTVTGLPYSPSTSNLATENIYYSDPSRAGGSVAYQATTNVATAAQVGDVHTVGAINMPVAAAPPTTGNPVRPPGIGTISKL